MMPAAKKKPKPAPAELTILDVINDDAIFGPWFKDRESWVPWVSFLKTVFGHELDEAELKIFQECTGRTVPFAVGYLIAALVIGRRGGKSLILALVAAYLAAFRDWTPFLTGGETGHIVILAADRRQARAIFGYLKGMLTIDLLAGLITRETAETIELGSKRVAITIETASFKTIRGRTIVAALCDEQAFWSADDSGANPDSEVIAAIKPAMLSIPGAMLFMASSPYSKRGVLWDEYQRHFGRDESTTLVWQASTLTMNPKAPQDLINEMYESDPGRAAAEYGAQFRTDVSGWLDLATIQAAVDTDVTVRPPISLNYVGFCDSSGGVKDSFTMAVAHAEASTAVLDCLIEIPAPFNPSEAVGQIAAVLKSYKLTEVTGDRYASGFTVDAFAQCGIKYVASERDRSTIYTDALPMFGSGRVHLLDNKRLVTQLAALERKTHPGGRDKIDHPRGQKDDAANSACGALVLATAVVRGPRLFFA